MSIINPPIEVLNYGHKLLWTYDGEGYNGDYDPSDPEDTPLLRFTVMAIREAAWECVEDGSYCTRISVDTEEEALIVLGYDILHMWVLSGHSKRALEDASWMLPKERKNA